MQQPKKLYHNPAAPSSDWRCASCWCSQREFAPLPPRRFVKAATFSFTSAHSVASLRLNSCHWILEQWRKMISQTSFLDRYDAEVDEKKSSSQDEQQQSCTDEEPPPDEDEDGASWPSAPPLEYIDSIQGYEMVSFDARNCPPPPPPVVDPAAEGEGIAVEEEKQPSPPTPPQVPIVLETDTRLTDEQAKASLLLYLSNHCCYGKSAAKDMVVKKMECMPAFHYELQTFSEKRETSWTYSPLKSGLPDSSGGHVRGGAVPPLPWEIDEYPAQAFKDEMRMLAVPNTSSIKSCHRCRGTGGVLCRDCNGKGWSRCIHCHGDGWLGDSGGHRERCFYCHHSKQGHGHQDCSKCHTKGKVNCATCDGQGQIRCYIQLSITWKVHTAEHIVEKLELPRELIRDVSGQVAFEEEAQRIKPLALIPDKDIMEASIRLITNHDNAFADQKIVCQRHQVRVVPITRVTYEWKGKLHSFHVYGYENKVHVANYPQNCCWGCQVL